MVSKNAKLVKRNTAKGFKDETISRILTKANEIRRAYIERMQNGGDLPALCISKGNRKIGRVMNVSLMPVMTCANCSGCKHYCYDIKACAQYAETVIDARIRNTVLAQFARDEFFSRISAAMDRRRKNKFFRWHVAGEILDADYLRRMIENAGSHPDFVIWTYTKNYRVVNDYVAANGGTRDCIPANLHIMFSEWRGMELVNPYSFPVFMCRFPGEAVPAGCTFKCPGNCDICKELHRGCIAGENTYNDLH